MEGLNSKVDHKDYMYDYHQMGRDAGQEGRLPAVQAALRHLSHANHGGGCHPHHRDYKDYIAHFHTGGVPAGMKSTTLKSFATKPHRQSHLGYGYQGYLGQEFIPVREPSGITGPGFRICDV